LIRITGCTGSKNYLGNFVCRRRFILSKKFSFNPLPPTSGTVTVDGSDFTRQASEVRRMIGYVPQSLSADGCLTGNENLLFLPNSMTCRAQIVKPL